MAVPGEQAEVAAFLAGLSDGPPLETHISALFRSADTVWKLKKAVRLGFLDFSAVGARQHFLQRELDLNTPFVPGLYRDVVPVTRQRGGLALGGDGPAVDWVLRMACVPEADFLDSMAAAGRLDPPLLQALADEVAAMHAMQPRARVDDVMGQLHQVADGNARAARAAGLDEACVAAWQGAIAAAMHRAAPSLQARAPLIRRAHGDLHLGNMLMWQGRPLPFDALEFDEALATIDPGYDLAFLLMDLDLHVSRAAANLVLCRYVARTGDAGLVAGLPVFLSLRALIRAHVEAARGRDATVLLRAAQAYLVPSRPFALAIGGLMGSGKSTLARALAPGIGAAPGALVLRSDEIRKRLHGVLPEDRLPEDAYLPEANRRTEAALLEAMCAALAGGHAVIVDATLHDPAFRLQVAETAAQAGVPLLGVWLDVPLPLLEGRVEARRGDASDATVAVLRAAAAALQRPTDWLVVDGAGAVAEQTIRARLAML